MLDYLYIENNSIYVVNYGINNIFIKGYQYNDYCFNKDVKYIKRIPWQSQPKELKEFWQAYEYAIWTLHRKDLEYPEIFYNEWIKNPKKFTEGHRNVISSFLTELENINKKMYDVMIVNYDSYIIENHDIEIWLKVLKELNIDIDVVHSEIDVNGATITIQCDDQELLKEVEYLVNKYDINNE